MSLRLSPAAQMSGHDTKFTPFNHLLETNCLELFAYAIGGKSFGISCRQKSILNEKVIGILQREH